MSTFLQLTNKCLRRTNDVELTNTTFGSAVGVHAATKDSVQSAIDDIYNSEYKWPFTYAEHSYTLTPGVQKYALPNNTRYMDMNSVRIVGSESLGCNNDPVTPINYEEWIRRYRPRDLLDKQDAWGIPTYVFRYPDRNIGFSRIPNKAYTVITDIYAKPAPLVLASDATPIPDDFDYVIVPGAMYYNYLFRGNAEQAAIMSNKFESGIRDMRAVLINRYENVASTYIQKYGNGMGAQHGYI